MNQTFEELYSVVDSEIEKRRYKWTLKAVNWMDFSDVKQIILIHVFNKWSLWNQEKEFLPWVNALITNQIINLLRNLYTNVARPCLGCPANEGEDRCRIYQKQCSKCNIYSYWERHKKVAHDMKLPVSIENHQQEIRDIPGQEEDFEGKAEYIHNRMKEMLTSNQYKVYQLLYIENLSKDEIAEKMNYKTSEKNRARGYKVLKEMEKMFMEKVRKIVFKELY